MPYFVYQIHESTNHLVKQLTMRERFDSFRPAKSQVREYRASDENSKDEYKIIFADNELEAEELLQEKRETPVLMEWEK